MIQIWPLASKRTIAPGWLYYFSKPDTRATDIVLNELTNGIENSKNISAQTRDLQSTHLALFTWKPLNRYQITNFFEFGVPGYHSAPYTFGQG